MTAKGIDIHKKKLIVHIDIVYGNHNGLFTLNLI